LSCEDNDLHFADTLANCPFSYNDFWRLHPEYWLGEECKEGWNKENAPLMTRLVEQVRQKTDSLSQVRGKKILLAVRVPLTVENGISSLYGVSQHSQLPLAVSASSFSHADMVVGDDFSDGYPEEAFLFVKTDNIATFKAVMNDVALEKVEDDQYLTAYDRFEDENNKQQVYAFRIPPETVLKGNNQLKFLSESGIFIVLRIEMALKYGDTDTHGYF
jgi:hypothetical protein